MRKNLVWTFVLIVFAIPMVSHAGLFSFIKCAPEKGSMAPTCKLCLSPSSGGRDSICSKTYSTNPGTNDPTPGFSNISKELTEDLTRQLARVKELPKEGFDVREFYEKYADYAPEDAEKEIEFIDNQIKFLKWKKAQILKGQSKKKQK